RALKALRIAGAYALSRPVSRAVLNGQPANGRAPQYDEGALLVKKGLVRPKQVAVSGAVTSRSLSSERARGLGSAQRSALLESLDGAMAQFTAAKYGRAETLNDADLDAALGAGKAAVKRVTIEQTWLMRKFGRRPPPREVEARAWSR